MAAKKLIDLSLVSFDELWTEIGSRYDTAICATLGHDGEQELMAFKFQGRTLDGVALVHFLERYVDGYAAEEMNADQEGR